MAKKEAVKKIFNDIAPRYDALNHLLSLGIDKGWRKRALKSIEEPETKRLLDVACGTGDFSVAAVKAGVREVTGIDISEKMVEIGRQKVRKLGLEKNVCLQEGDSERMSFGDASFDVVTVAFGVRNFENLEKGLQEIQRVLTPGGKVIILEFSMPVRFPVKQLYTFYFRRILPLIGGFLSGNRGAYAYLPESVKNFPQGEQFLSILKACGFRMVSSRRFTFGIASLYCGIK
ncbi:MAG: bifunctional demethylmenaquinone methyltransferase/2-methoxy-6-polyprenyl-1,4-benzoquinol methylase UbiE [Odoribacter sp.]|nr:bifunctional demethylmenaquinone methyltransferase/2-methoxy-6-polyprenyl-1,4-benzoquinol methylase UbiE [Odoribacter sp.]